VSATTPGRIGQARLEVLWQGLLAITDEAAWTLVRTSFSNVVREAWDFSVMLYDERGRLVAQNAVVAGKIGVRHFAVEAVLDLYRDRIRPGDVFLTNAPWLSDGHLYDPAIVRPLFFDGRLTGFAECTEHLSDIGGSISSIPRELIEEGLVIPVIRLVQEGEENDEIVRLIEANVRTPRQDLGDLRAMISATRACEQRLVELLERNGLDGVLELADEILERSEEATRASIRRAIPDGVYEGGAYGDGWNEPLVVRVRIEVRDGDVTIDFTGSSPQSSVGINSPLNFTASWAAFAVHCVAGVEVGSNHGSFAPIRVTAPEGCVVNPRRDAPVRMRATSSLLIPNAIFDALALQAGDRVLADSSSPTWVERISGTTASGRRFSQIITANGGMGARLGKDGISCLPFPNNASNTPVEVIEETMPLLVEERRLVEDSGGPGRFRGGLGQQETFRLLADLNLIFQNAHLTDGPRGRLGGKSGLAGSASVNGEPVPANAQRSLVAGDRFTLRLPGGGGMQDPHERPRDAVAHDVKEQLVSRESARDHYLVVLTDTGEVDEAATDRMRASKREDVS
jgi:N-methylhydantoinase B